MGDKGSKYCGCLYFSANALARITTRMAEESFSVTGLAPSYAFLLMTVNDQPGIQPSQISEHMMLAPSTVTRLIEKMETKKFVERKINGKFTQVFPTQKSLDLNGLIHQAWQNLYTKYAGLLGTEKSQQLTTEIFASTKLLGE